MHIIPIRLIQSIVHSIHVDFYGQKMIQWQYISVFDGLVTILKASFEYLSTTQTEIIWDLKLRAEERIL